MAIIFNDNIKINAGKPVDAKYLNTGNTSYATTTEVNNTIVVPERHIGLTVNVANNEYWYKDGVANINLVPKLSGLIAGSGTITGATNIGFFSGTSGIQTLDITTNSNLPVPNHLDYRGLYTSVLGFYYRDEFGIIRAGISEANIAPRLYVKTTTPIKSWIWNDKNDLGNQRGWFLMNGDASTRIGQQIVLGVDGINYYGLMGAYTNTTWSSPPPVGDRTAFIIAVIGNLATGVTTTLGAPVYSRTIHSGTTLELRALRSLSPQTLSVCYDDAFINISGASINGQNIGCASGSFGNVFSNFDGNLFRFRRLRGVGDTVVTTIGNDILINSIAGGIGIAFADNGLALSGNTVVLGGMLNNNVEINANNNSLSINNIGDFRLRTNTGHQISFNDDAGFELTGNTFVFNDNSLVTKKYVDNLGIGITPIGAVDLATTTGESNINLSIGGLLTIDGVVTTEGMRVLVKNQNINPIENGIYIASVGAWLRANDYNGTPTGEVIQGNIIPIIGGNTLNNQLWVLITPNPIIIGTTPLTFTNFSKPIDIVGGNGINITQTGGQKTVGVRLHDNGGLGFVGNELTVNQNNIVGSGLNRNPITNRIDLGGIITGNTIIEMPNDNTIFSVGGLMSNSYIRHVSGDFTEIWQSDPTFDIISTFLEIRCGGLRISSDDYINNISGVICSCPTSISIRSVSNSIDSRLIVSQMNASIEYRDCLNTTISRVLSYDSGTEIISWVSNLGNVVLNLLSGTTATISSTFSGFKGIEYGGDYRHNFVNRSLVDKQYVDICINSAVGGITIPITGASNGLSVINNNVVLGGTLTNETTINANLNQIIFSNFSNLILNNNDISVAIRALGLDIDNTMGNYTYRLGCDMSANVVGHINLNSSDINLIASRIINISGCTIGISGQVSISGGINISQAPIMGESYQVLVRDFSGFVRTIDSNEINNNYCITTASTNITLTSNMYVVLANTNADSIILTLPLSPINGQAYRIKDASGNAAINNIIINGNGRNIDGASTAIVNTNFGAIEIVYNAAFNRWFVLSFVN